MSSRKQWELTFALCVFIAVTPIAWFIHHELSANGRYLAIALLMAAAFAVRHLVYKPIRKRLFGDV